MKTMKTGWLSKLIAILVLLSSCGAVIADCHGHCFDGCCCGVSSNACECAIVLHCFINPNTVYTPFSLYANTQIPRTSGTDIFRPPESLF